MAFYIESGTGRQISDLSQIDPSKTYFESGTGKQISGSQLVQTQQPSIAYGATNTYQTPTQTTSTSTAPGSRIAAPYESATRIAEQNLIDYLNFIGRPAVNKNGQWVAPPGVNIVYNSNGTINTQQSSGKQTLITLGDGSKVYIDQTGQAFDATTGAPRANADIARATASQAATQQNDYMAALEQYLQRQLENGNAINPNITIDASKLQEFAALAAKEIDPYYAEQLKTGLNDFLLERGYSRDQLLENEKRLSQKYGVATRQLGEQAADQGFAQSGLRQRGERDLALETQQSINDTRKQFEFDTTGLGRKFEKVFGSSQVPSFSLGNRPTVGAGEMGFGTSPDSPLYNLSDTLYGGIKGSNTYEADAAKRLRESQLAEGYRSGLSLNQLRSFTI